MAGERAGDDVSNLPVIARVVIRVMFREGPVVFAFLVMLGVMLGIIPSPYLGKPLETLVDAHKEQLIVLEQIRDDLKQWHQTDNQRRR